MEFFSGGANSLCITAVYHIDDSLCIGIVTPPIWAYACLTSQIPNLELDVLVCDRLYIESNGCKKLQRQCQQHVNTLNAATPYKLGAHLELSILPRRLEACLQREAARR